MDDDSVASTSSSDENDIEDELNDEDTSTPSLYPCVHWSSSCRSSAQEQSSAQEVMETIQSLQRRNSNMDFEEALAKAAYRRKHIIEQATIDAKQDEEQDSETSDKKSKWSV